MDGSDHFSREVEWIPPKEARSITETGATQISFSPAEVLDKKRLSAALTMCPLRAAARELPAGQV
jgi:hypothetical protein